MDFLLIETSLHELRKKLDDKNYPYAIQIKQKLLSSKELSRILCITKMQFTLISYVPR